MSLMDNGEQYSDVKTLKGYTLLFKTQWGYHIFSNNTEYYKIVCYTRNERSIVSYHTYNIHNGDFTKHFRIDYSAFYFYMLHNYTATSIYEYHHPSSNIEGILSSFKEMIRDYNLNTIINL